MYNIHRDANTKQQKRVDLKALKSLQWHSNCAVKWKNFFLINVATDLLNCSQDSIYLFKASFIPVLKQDQNSFNVFLDCVLKLVSQRSCSCPSVYNDCLTFIIKKVWGYNCLQKYLWIYPEGVPIMPSILDWRAARTCGFCINWLVSPKAVKLFVGAPSSIETRKR